MDTLRFIISLPNKEIGYLYMMLDKRKKISVYLSLVFFIGILELRAQVPIINNLSITYGTVNEKIIVSGNNFSINIGSLKVFFGSVGGNVTITSSNLIEVEVPPGTTTDNVVVINTSTGLSGSSSKQFYLSYSGDNFDPSQLDPEVSYPNPVELFDLCLCDFNNDGKSDVATTKVDTETDILIFENNSIVESINLTEHNKTTNPELDLGSPTSNITCGDLNGDGLPDLVASKTGNPRNVIYILENISSGGNIEFAASISLFLPVDEIAKRLEIKDLDLNGKPEIIVSNTFNENLKIFRNTSTAGNIQFNPTPRNISISGAGMTNGLVVEDINGDLLPDLVTGPFFDSNIYVRLNNSTPGSFVFDAVQTIDVAGNLNVITSGDFNNDGSIDLAVTLTVQNEVVILENLTPANSGTVSFTQQNISTDGDPWGINAADMDGDGKIDLLISLRDANAINLFENTGTGTSISYDKHVIPITRFSTNIVGGDIDGDAKPDIVFTSFDTSPQFTLTVIRNANCFKPVIEPLGPLNICSGSSFDLFASKGTGITYTWDRDNIVFKTGSEGTILVTQPGVYKVIAESQSGTCSEVSNAVIVNLGLGSVPSDPVIYNNGPFCNGGVITLTTDNVAGGTFLWQGPDNFTSTDQNITVPDASPLKAGIYSLQVSVGDCSSNVSTTTVDLITLPGFTISASGLTKICVGDSVQLNVNALSGYTYQWYLEGQPVTGEVNSSINATENGAYQAEITETSTTCTAFSNNSIDINVIAKPVADFNYTDPECVNTEIQFINSSTFEPGESVGYSWDFGDGSFIVNNENPAHTYTLENDYTITFVVAYTGGLCRDTLQAPITVNPRPLLELVKIPDAIICEQSPLNLSTSVAFSNYLWNTGQTTRQITTYMPGDYAVTVTDSNRCVTQEFITVDMLPKPEITATANPEETFEGSDVQLHASGALSYLWTPGDLVDNPIDSDPIATVNETTEFFVFGTNAEGCSDTASVVVRVVESNAINVDPRKVFTPNGDGIDDTWHIDYIENYPEAEIIIYNANGSVVYESKNYNNTWDAVYEGKDLPETAYFYVIRYYSKNPKTGSVTVIR
jgi:gliding motility-associated-like protein